MFQAHPSQYKAVREHTELAEARGRRHVRAAAEWPNATL